MRPFTCVYLLDGEGSQVQYPQSVLMGSLLTLQGHPWNSDLRMLHYVYVLIVPFASLVKVHVQHCKTIRSRV